MSLTLRFNGGTPQTITAADQTSNVFSAVVNPGATFSFVGSISNDKFVGPNVSLTVNGVPNATIPSICGSVFVGNVYGNFTIVAALSKTGGALCCSAGSIETTPPQITGCPSNITLDLPAGACSIAGGWISPVAADNCAVASFTASHNPTDLLPVGVTTVIYTAADNYSNSSTCSFTVSVSDNTPPVIANCPGDITIEAASPCEAVVSWTASSATHNCSATMSASHSPGATFPIGTTAITYTASDPTGNVTSCSFNVIITDTTAPIIAGCPGDITIEAAASCEAVVSWTAPTATDNCSASLSASHSPGTTFAIGTTAITYTASDPTGNVTTCSFNVIVTDTTAPIIAGCPADITVAAGSCESVVSWTPPTATDNCSTTLSASHAPGSIFAVGSTTVTYTATDPAGHTTTCSFNVTVADTTVPVISGCPADIVLSTTACEAVVSWTLPTATDNCLSGLTASHQPGGTFPLGTTTITYTASDEAGHSATCSFTVTVRTDAALVLTGCPDNITLHTYEEEVTVTWTAPQATPVCGNLSSNVSHLPDTQFGAGVTEVVYEFQDGTGNKSVCSFDVTIIRDEISFEVSKAITPNGDGINDMWMVTNIEKFKDNTVLVVDRWGNRIYYGSAYDNSNVQWNGTGPGGGRVPVGTYFYTIEVRISGSMVRDSGFVEVIY